MVVVKFIIGYIVGWGFESRSRHNKYRPIRYQWYLWIPKRSASKGDSDYTPSNNNTRAFRSSQIKDAIREIPWWLTTAVSRSVLVEDLNPKFQANDNNGICVSLL